MHVVRLQGARRLMRARRMAMPARDVPAYAMILATLISSFPCTQKWATIHYARAFLHDAMMPPAADARRRRSSAKFPCYARGAAGRGYGLNVDIRSHRMLLDDIWLWGYLLPKNAYAFRSDLYSPRH